MRKAIQLVATLIVLSCLFSPFALLAKEQWDFSFKCAPGKRFVWEMQRDISGLKDILQKTTYSVTHLKELENGNCEVQWSMTLPPIPVYRSQPRVAPASTARRAEILGGRTVAR